MRRAKLTMRGTLERDIKTILIKIYQKRYILNILRRFKMDDFTSVSTSLPPGVTFMPSSGD